MAGSRGRKPIQEVKSLEDADIPGQAIVPQGEVATFRLAGTDTVGEEPKNQDMLRKRFKTMGLAWTALALEGGRAMVLAGHERFRVGETVRVPVGKAWRGAHCMGGRRPKWAQVLNVSARQ